MGLMRSLRKLLVTGFVWLTACATLAAALPQWQCCCADQNRKIDAGWVPSCCCGQPAQNVTPVKSCCQAKHVRKAPARQAPAPKGIATCARTLVPHGPSTTDRANRTTVESQAGFWVLNGLPSTPRP